MRRISRTLITAALVAAVIGGTAGFASGDSQQPVTGAPAGTAEWRAAGLPDPERMTPAEVARFFAGLSPVRQRELARTHPTVVGNLDGRPWSCGTRPTPGSRTGRSAAPGSSPTTRAAAARWPWCTGIWRGRSTCR